MASPVRGVSGRTVLLVPLGAIAAVALVASTAWACGAYVGTFKVEGGAGGSSATTGLGTGDHPPQCALNYYGCGSELSLSAGPTAPGAEVPAGLPDGSASSMKGIKIYTDSVAGSPANKLPEGTYAINLINGPVYARDHGGNTTWEDSDREGLHDCSPFGITVDFDPRWVRLRLGPDELRAWRREHLAAAVRELPGRRRPPDPPGSSRLGDRRRPRTDQWSLGRAFHHAPIRGHGVRGPTTAQGPFYRRTGVRRVEPPRLGPVLPALHDRADDLRRGCRRSQCVGRVHHQQPRHVREPGTGLVRLDSLTSACNGGGAGAVVLIQLRCTMDGLSLEPTRNSPTLDSS